MYKFLLVLLAIGVCLLGLSFHLKNEHLVQFNYYIGSFEYHFSVFILVSLIIGVVLGVLAMLPKQLLLIRKNRQLNKQIDMNRKEVDNLRAIPIKDSH